MYTILTKKLTIKRRMKPPRYWPPELRSRRPLGLLNKIKLSTIIYTNESPGELRDWLRLLNLGVKLFIGNVTTEVRLPTSQRISYYCEYFCGFRRRWRIQLTVTHLRQITHTSHDFTQTPPHTLFWWSDFVAWMQPPPPPYVQIQAVRPMVAPAPPYQVYRADPEDQIPEERCCCSLWTV